MTTLLAKAIRTLDGRRRSSYANSVGPSRVAAVERFDWNTLAARLSTELAPFDHFEAATDRLP